MNLQQKAEIRKQIEEMTTMQRELKQDLAIVDAKIKKIEDFKKSKKKISATDQEIIKSHLDIYTQNKFQLETTIYLSQDIINQLKLENTPRAAIQVTRKLI